MVYLGPLGPFDPDPWLVKHEPIVAGLPDSIRSDFEPPKPPARFAHVEPLQASDGSWYVISARDGTPMPVEVEEVHAFGSFGPVRHIVLREIP